MTSILRQSYWADLTTKTSKTNGFDTIEIDLVTYFVNQIKESSTLRPWSASRNFIFPLIYYHCKLMYHTNCFINDWKENIWTITKEPSWDTYKIIGFVNYRKYYSNEGMTNMISIINWSREKNMGKTLLTKRIMFWYFLLTYWSYSFLHGEGLCYGGKLY